MTVKVSAASVCCVAALGWVALAQPHLTSVEARQVPRRFVIDAHQHWRPAPEEPILLGASAVPLVGLAAMLLLVRNNAATRAGIVQSV